MGLVSSARTKILELSRIVKRFRGHWVPTNIQVLGHRGSGKTTLLKQLEKRGHTDSGGPTSGSSSRWSLVEEASRIRLDTFDIGGDAMEWNLWRKMIVLQPPAGFIFLIDHMHSFQEHEDALKFLIGILKDEENVRKRCKVFLLFANKRDEWQAQSDIDSFAMIWKDRFLPILNKIEEMGIKILIGSGSAQKYEFAPDEFDDLMSKFVDLVL